ncbi:MAG: zf-TFIIB domain-containing protein [Acidobacteria bacterium]|nr:zf-TFIIB domain-containing protein [Acidobacteriota bacterium]
MSDQLEERGRALENEYFHRKEKELIAKMKAKLEIEETKDLELECPKCDGTLLETAYENIVIDVCNKCSGVWLDAGELAQAVEKNEDSGWLSRFIGK